MASPQQQIVVLQKDIGLDERAIRHLIGEDAALNNQLKRMGAKLVLEQARLSALLHRHGGLTPGERFADVSNNEPNIDVAAYGRNLKQLNGAGLLVTKLTEGTSFVDQLGLIRIAAARKAGLHVGGYMFGHPSMDAHAQVAFFLAHGGADLKAGDRAINDLEVSDGAGAAAVRNLAAVFAAEVPKHTPADLFLYGGGPFLSGNGVPIKGYWGHWLPAYVSDPRRYRIYGALTRWWQFTDGVHGPTPHSAPGIGACDLSIVL